MLRIKFPKMLQNPTLSSHLHAILGLSWWLSGKEFAGDAGLIPGQEDSLEGEMAIHSIILVLEIPGTEEPGRL